MSEYTNKGFWNRFASIYDFTRKGDRSAYASVFQNTASFMNTDMQVLEVATGTGLIALQVAPFCNSIIATDFSENMIHVANQKDKPDNLTFAVEDATKLSFADKSFDMVIIANALHIMPEPEKALVEIRRVLKDDGVLIAPNFVRGNTFRENISASFMKFFGFKIFANRNFDGYISFLSESEWAIIKTDCFKATFPLAFVAAKKSN